ncbi:SDR family NAD(P)-dependent oxidoreductase [Rhodococcus olei]|uniref:SDR family NAD(P)-dependent oxidoreductase n=1 Tax=Rhodococcus olei TaxID=2161675 RepID=A0ABP8P8Q8_9NOCA
MLALITGGARGLGAAIADRLAASGYGLALLDVNEEALGRTGTELRRRHDVPVLTRICDVRSAAQVTAAFDAAEEIGSPTALVNSAGIGRYSKFVDLTEEEWDNTFAVNTKGTFLTCQQMLRRAEPESAIVNLASIGARMGAELLAHYGASKAAVIELSHSVARVGAQQHIRSNTVLPGFIHTDIWTDTVAWARDRDPSLAGVSDQEFFDNYVERAVPMRRAQTPQDIAETVAFLLSPAARNITGQTIAVDGGVILT